MAGSAYEKLSEIFARFQAAQEEQERLLGVKWLCGEDEQDTIDDASRRIAALRTEQVMLMTDPAHDTGGLLAAAAKETQGLNDWRRANLREMERTYGYYRGMAAQPGIRELVAELEEAAKNAE